MYDRWETYGKTYNIAASYWSAAIFSPLSNHLWACLLVYSPFPFFAAADNDGGSNGNDMLWGKDDILWWWCGGVVGGGGSTGGGIVVVAVGGVEVKVVW